MAMPSIGPMCFLKYDGEVFVGICGLYVDDFTIAGKVNDPRRTRASEKRAALKRLNS